MTPDLAVTADRIRARITERQRQAQVRWITAACADDLLDLDAALAGIARAEDGLRDHADHPVTGMCWRCKWTPPCPDADRYTAELAAWTSLFNRLHQHYGGST